MKKIPTLFTRIYDNHKIVGIMDQITPGCEEAFLNGTATVKFDGSCCAIIDGVFYKRFDAKKGRKIPVRAIPCCEADPITGHHPHWVKVTGDPADKWFLMAFGREMTVAPDYKVEDGTYEAIGPHFQGNPYGLREDILVRHGGLHIGVGRNFEDIKEYLRTHDVEGIVFWLNGEPVCKIKRTDFGYPWPV